jgi:hypothetical protein
MPLSNSVSSFVEDIPLGEKLCEIAIPLRITEKQISYTAKGIPSGKENVFIRLNAA